MKIGDYVRTKYGIAKIIDIYERNSVNLKTGKSFIDLEYRLDKGIIPSYEGNSVFCDKEDIIKCEEEPIDLIEIGDYVNGREVRDVYKMLGETHYCFKNEYGRHYDKTYKIKSIVTKEQFESMEYKVVE